jgi:hypothetical protein
MQFCVAMAATAGVLVVYRENLMVRISTHWSAPRSRVSGHIWFSTLSACKYYTSHAAHNTCFVVWFAGREVALHAVYG